MRFVWIIFLSFWLDRIVILYSNVRNVKVLGLESIVKLLYIPSHTKPKASQKVIMIPLFKRFMGIFFISIDYTMQFQNSFWINTAHSCSSSVSVYHLDVAIFFLFNVNTTMYLWEQYAVGFSVFLKNEQCYTLVSLRSHSASKEGTLTGNENLYKDRVWRAFHQIQLRIL